MSTEHILCIKIKQSVIGTPNATHFPFDRIYFCTTNTLPKLKRAFKYLLFTEIHPYLLKGLNQHINQYTPRKIERLKRYEEQQTEPCFFNINTVKDKYNYMCIPTMIKSRQKRNYNLVRTTHYKLKYLSSPAQKHDYQNSKTPKFNLRLKTPRIELSTVCISCSKLLDMYANQCSVGSPECSRNAYIRLKPDPLATNK